MIGVQKELGGSELFGQERTTDVQESRPLRREKQKPTGYS